MKRHFRARIAVPAGVALLVGVGSGVGISNATTSADAAPPAPAKATKQQIAALFDEWNAALVSGDPQRIADRYAPDAVLLPTASPKIRTDRAEIVDYFEHFVQKKPSGEKIRSVINVLDADSAIDAGTYRFTLTGKDGRKTTVDARYTYEYEKRGDRWLIVNHHSSVLPAAG